MLKGAIKDCAQYTTTFEKYDSAPNRIQQKTVAKTGLQRDCPQVRHLAQLLCFEQSFSRLTFVSGVCPISVRFVLLGCC